MIRLLILALLTLSIADAADAKPRRKKGGGEDDMFGDGGVPPSGGGQEPGMGEAPTREPKRRGRRGKQRFQQSQIPPGGVPYFSVIRVDRDAETVSINGGGGHGLRKDQLVCFLNDFREMFGCDKITAINRSSAVISITGKAMALFKVGTAARPALPQEVTSYGSVGNANRVSYAIIGYAFSPLLPFTYRVATFAPDARGDEEVPAWGQGTKTTSSATNGTLLFQLPISESLGLAIGFIGRSLKSTKAQSPFDNANEAQLVDSSVSASAVAVPMTVRWLTGSGPVQLLLGEGLQWDHSEVKYRAFAFTDGQDDRGEIASYTSILNTMGIRGDIGGALKVGQSSNISLALGLVVPFISFGKTKIGRFDLPPGMAPLELQESDLERAIGHERAKVGLDLTLAVGVGF